MGWICAGCGEPVPCKSDCPAGMYRKGPNKKKPIEFHCEGFEKMPKKTQQAIVEMIKQASKAQGLRRWEK